MTWVLICRLRVAMSFRDPQEGHSGHRLTSLAAAQASVDQLVASPWRRT
jgi:hypothetical protein